MIFIYALDFHIDWNKSLAVKLKTTHKPAKPPENQPIHPQTTQTTHRPPAIHPQTSQTTRKPDKYWTNHPLISQKSHPFSLKTFIMIRYKLRTQQLQHLLPHKIRPFCSSRTIREEKRNKCIFWCSCQISHLTFSTAQFLPSLFADYNSSHKLLTQLRTLTNFSRRPGLTILHWRFFMVASTLRKSSYKHPKGYSLVDFLKLATTFKIKSFRNFDKALGS